MGGSGPSALKSSHQIIINSEKGSLSQVGIDRILQKAEKFWAENEANNAKTDAKNG